MKLSKVICTVTILALIITSAGCGAKKTGDNEIPTLTWYVFGTAKSDIASVMNEVNKITVPEIGARLDLQFIDNSAFEEKMKMKMASREKFDLCFTGYINDYEAAVENGGLAELNGLVDQYAPELYKLIPESFMKDAMIKGKLYAIPNVQVGFQQYSSMIDEKLYKESGLQYSETNKMSELEPYLEYVKKTYPDRIPWRTNYGESMWVYPTYESIIGDIGIKNDGSSTKAVILRDTPEYKEGIKKIREWYQKGYIRPDVSSVTDDTNDLKAGKYAVTQGTWKPGGEAYAKRLYGLDYYTVKMMEPYMPSGFSRTTMIGIGEFSDNKEKAIKFISLINSNTKLYNLICFGIEGKHYLLDENNKVEAIENSGYKLDGAWKFGNQFNAYKVQGEDDSVWEETKRLNNEARRSPIIGFTLNTEKIQNEASQLQALKGEYSSVVSRGYMDTSEYYTEMEKRIKAAGEDAVLQEVQRQLDDYFANKK